MSLLSNICCNIIEIKYNIYFIKLKKYLFYYVK